MWHPNLFRFVGWAVIISSAALLCIPWQWHQRFGGRIRPTFNRYLWVYAVGAFAFGVLLLFALFPIHG